MGVNGAVVTVLILIILSFLFVGLDARQKRYNHKKISKDRHHANYKWDMVKKSGNKLDKHVIRLRNISWLKVPEVVGCKCKLPGEICIKGPDHKPICIQEHHLKESARLFKHFHERKEKAEEKLNQIEIDSKPYYYGKDWDHKKHHWNKMKHEPTAFTIKGNHKQGNLILGIKPKPGKHSHFHQHKTTTEVNHDETIQHEGGSSTSSVQAVCSAADLAEMRRRLTGWFHLLHGKGHHKHHGNKHHHKAHRHLSVKKELREGDGKCDCLKSVMWEFRQIDADHSHTLNRSEVKVIDNNDMEPCLHPYLVSCDTDADGLLTRHEWCCCFTQRESESPCYSKLKEIEGTKNTEQYIPSCDREGYYQREQCQGRAPGGQTCWCVTPNGAEITGSRKKGRAHCGKFNNV